MQDGELVVYTMKVLDPPPQMDDELEIPSQQTEKAKIIVREHAQQGGNFESSAGNNLESHDAEIVISLMMSSRPQPAGPTASIK